MLAPAIRSEFSLSLGQVGILLGSEWIGLILALLPWGFAVDRFGERWTLAAGMLGCGSCLAGAAYAPGFVPFVLLIAVAGGAGASVQS
ncbi:MAG: MFS transporter, partial [Gaiellaceae bacterium]